MITSSAELGELATALAKAQGEIKDAEKLSENSFLDATFADLSSNLKEIRPVLSKHGLSFVQFPSQEHEGHVTLTTRLLHASGQWLQDSMTMPVQAKNAAQGSGVVISYMRRYVIAAVVGVSQVDPDGEQGKLGAVKPKEPTELPWYNTAKEDKARIIKALEDGSTASVIIAQLRKKHRVSKESAAIIEGYDNVEGTPDVG